MSAREAFFVQSRFGGDDFHTTLQEILQEFGQVNEIVEVLLVGIKLDKKIDVAFWGLFATNEGSKNSDLFHVEIFQSSGMIANGFEDFSLCLNTCAHIHHRGADATTSAAGFILICAWFVDEGVWHVHGEWDHVISRNRIRAYLLAFMPHLDSSN